MALLLAAAITSGGCATVLHGPSQTVHIKTEPPGVTVLVEGVARAETPVDLKLHGDVEQLLTLHKDGYHDETVKLNGTIRPIFYLNFLTLGLTALVDLGTGAMFEIFPTEIEKTLAPEPHHDR